MGAYGAALIAKDKMKQGVKNTKFYGFEMIKTTTKQKH